eukprot:7421499-Pyramimonas_sp.AAC.2
MRGRGRTCNVRSVTPVKSPVRLCPCAIFIRPSNMSLYTATLDPIPCTCRPPRIRSHSVAFLRGAQRHWPSQACPVRPPQHPAFGPTWPRARWVIHKYPQGRPMHTLNA